MNRIEEKEIDRIREDTTTKGTEATKKDSMEGRHGGRPSNTCLNYRHLS